MLGAQIHQIIFFQKDIATLRLTPKQKVQAQRQTFNFPVISGRFRDRFNIFPTVSHFGGIECTNVKPVAHNSTRKQNRWNMERCIWDLK